MISNAGAFLTLAVIELKAWSDLSTESQDDKPKSKDLLVLLEIIQRCQDLRRMLVTWGIPELG